jgi:hypothetical protein
MNKYQKIDVIKQGLILNDQSRMWRKITWTS